MEVQTQPVERSNEPSAPERAGPESDIREAARHLGQACTVLTGFSFTAIILLMQETQGPAGQSSLALRNQATASFLVGFIGYICASFNLAVLASDLKLSARPRPHARRPSGPACRRRLSGRRWLLTAAHRRWQCLGASGAFRGRELPATDPGY